MGYDSSDIGPTTPAGQQGGFVSQRFITANKLGLNRHVASQEIEQLEQQWFAQRFRVLNDVRIAFYDGES